MEYLNIIGEWDNFQQYWLERTEEEMHREAVEVKHRHFSLKIVKKNEDTIVVAIHEGRNAVDAVDILELQVSKLSLSPFRLDGDMLYTKDSEYFDNPFPYKFMRIRKFSGWIECPSPDNEEETYHQGNLELHDQGGMVELDLDHMEYTVELTQLIFAKKLAIMKLAIYDLPMAKVEINSKAISYTWVNPEAKRIGINLRKILSGWTLIEPNFISQNTTLKSENKKTT
ncbi:hypothetical protein [Costertonia aggregata]|uniref:Uncharacterized protein n=1 Tax=Costertonia aggregata TaxID=343403 RepID=A0A7H9ANQ0_9FLAO|nr:hypothetical protein [Costertonia aggregata]QLG45058.1 hypothetical protein HYG79_06740 [Costertonia aggregata]